MFTGALEQGQTANFVSIVTDHSEVTLCHPLIQGELIFLEYKTGSEEQIYVQLFT